MTIGSLLDDQLGKKVSYTYCQRGMDIPYLPDRVTEEEEKEIYTSEEGNLFFKRPVCWDPKVLVQEGVDIRITMEECCFVDHVWLMQNADSELKSVEVFTISDGEYQKIGNYQPETGKLIQTAEISVPVGFWCDNVIVRLNADCKPIHILKMDIWAAWGLKHTIWPTPAQAQYSEEYLSLSSLQKIQAVGEDARFAAKYLVEKLKEKTGYGLEITEAEGEIAFCMAQSSEKDAYSLKVTSDGCVVRAGSRRCLLYAVDALLQLIGEDRIRCADIEDEAFTDYRGVHFALPDQNQKDFLKNMVKYVFVPLRYNQIYLQISAAMRYDNYPEINEAWLEATRLYEEGTGAKPAHYSFVSKDIWEKEEVRELCEYFEAYGLEVIPEVQSWAHAQYITMAYPEMAERTAQRTADDNINLTTEDYRPDARYFHTMCPNHPDYYKVIFGVLDEVLEVVQPKRFVHMGHDEIYETRRCPLCKKFSGGELFAAEVNRLNDYIKKKGLRMMIWSDMLQPQNYATPTAINKVDKDIVMLDFVWYFHLDKEIEDNLLDHGFQVIMGNMYTSHYPRFTRRIHKKGMLGGEVSTWVHCSEFIYGYEGKMFDFFMSGEALWNSDYRDDLRLTNNERIKPLIGEARLAIGNLKSNKKSRKIMPGKLYEEERTSAEFRHIPYDIRGLAPFEKAIKVTCHKPQAEIAVNDYAEILTFTHATDIGSKRVMWDVPYKIGAYEICYEDGSVVEEALYYAANIYKYLAPFGDKISSPMFRHEGYVGTYLCLPVCGKTYNGEDYTLGKYSIRNPYPEKKLRSVRLLHERNTDAGIILFDLTIQ